MALSLRQKQIGMASIIPDLPLFPSILTSSSILLLAPFLSLTCPHMPIFWESSKCGCYVKNPEQYGTHGAHGAFQELDVNLGNRMHIHVYVPLVNAGDDSGRSLEVKVVGSGLV